MRSWKHIVAIGACSLAFAGLSPLLSRGAPELRSSAQTDGVPQALTLLVGQEIDVKFRGSDDIIYPEGVNATREKLDELSGKLLAVEHGWVTIQTSGSLGKEKPIVHIPFSTVAMILSPGHAANTQP